MLSPNRIDEANDSEPEMLPDPDEIAGRVRDVLIYDGQCVFCRGSVKSLWRLDWTGRLSFISLHDRRVAERWPELSHDQLMDQIWLVTPRGKKHGGADAMRYLSLRMPALWMLAPLLNLPLTMPIWRTLYRWIAKNRYRLAGRHCEGGSCSIHGK